MRVLLLNQTFYPDQAATSQQLIDFAKLLRSRGCEVTVLTSRRAYHDPRILHPASETFLGIKILRVWSTGFGKKSFLHRLADGVAFELSVLLRLIFLGRHDVVVAYTSPPLLGFLATLFCFFKGGRSVQWIMDLNPDIAFAVGYLNPKSIFGRLLTLVLRWTVRYSSFVVVLDRWMRSKMISHGVSPESIIIAPPWPINEPGKSSKELGVRFKARHGLEGKFVVLYSGNHSIAHPLDTVLNAALKLRDDSQVAFLFIGGGLRYQEVTDFREKHGLENLFQLPYQPREVLPESLSAAGLHLVLMGEQMTGLLHVSKVYGVMSTGTAFAFVGPRASHIGDLLKECPYGFHVEQGDAEGLCAAIRRAQAFTAKEEAEVAENTIRYVAAYCSAEASLAGFFSRVLEIDPPKALGQASQLPSRT
jgi:colanic acid biosynthesis glycosyl transferase WcaI